MLIKRLANLIEMVKIGLIIYFLIINKCLFTALSPRDTVVHHCCQQIVRLLILRSMLSYLTLAPCISKRTAIAYFSNLTIDERGPIGCRFSTNIMRTITALMSDPSPDENKIIVIATTSQKQAMEDIGINDAFDTICEIPLLTHEQAMKVIGECYASENYGSVSH